MNESSLNPKSNEPTSEPKLFGLPRHIAGALIGILLFLIIEFLLWRADLGELAMGLNYPGLFIASLIGIPLDFLVIGISSIPAAIIGSLIISGNTKLKIFGVILLITHIVLWIFFSIFFYMMGN